MKRFRKSICLCLTFVLTATLMAGCSETEKGADDDGRLTMYVGLGNTSGGYYEKLHEMILEDLGIDVKYTYNMTMDTSTAAVNKIRHKDLPADIMITASKVPEEYQKEAFLDLAAYTNLPDLFTAKRISEVSVDGSVYQLPFSTRLIGFEYNVTLFNEMGWEVPSTYQEMLELKEVVEEAGYPFAVSGGVAAGHGFNYLFHLMGADYLCSAQGSQWLKSFLNGTESVASFEREGAYFQTYVKNGLFGRLHTEDWNANKEAQRTRSAFYYNILNDISSYKGFRYNTDGTLYGAEYQEDGTPVMTEDPEGNAVLVGEEYVLYDEANEEHAGLTRYTIPGTVVLEDTYKAIPWISENGQSNCFALYDNMMVSLDKELGEKKNEDKLEQATRVLEYMTTKKVTDLFTGLYADGYVSVNDFDIDDTRVYSTCKDQIKNGYVMPWYYTNFENDTIVAVGNMVNSYIASEGSENFDAVIDELEECQKQKLSNSGDYVAEIEETLDYEDSAKVLAIAEGLGLEMAYADQGITEEVTAALLPYTTSLAEMPLYQAIGVAQEKFYQDKIDESGFAAYVGNNHKSPVGIYMTGSELKELKKTGYNTRKDFEYDHTYAYVLMTKDGADIDESKTYLVAVAPQSLEEDTYNAFLEAGKVITSSDGKPISGETKTGLGRFFELHPVLSTKTISWQ